MRVKAAIGVILVFCSTAGLAWSAPITLAVSPSSGTLTVGDTVTVTVTVDPTQLSYPPFPSYLQYGLGVRFDSRIFAFASQSAVADLGDEIFFDLLTPINDDWWSVFYYTDRSPFKSEFTFSETFTAIQGTRGPDSPTEFQVSASAWYVAGGGLVNILYADAPQSYDVIPNTPEPGALALSFIALAALGVRRARKHRRHSTTAA